MPIRHSFRRFLDRWRDQAEATHLSDRDAEDLGLSKTELQGYARARPNARAQMVEMAAKFGLTEADLNRDHWRALEVVHACTYCDKARGCQKYLNGEATEFALGRCPNFDTYSDLAEALGKST